MSNVMITLKSILAEMSRENGRFIQQARDAVEFFGLRDHNAMDVRVDAALALLRAFKDTRGVVHRYLGGPQCCTRSYIISRAIRNAALSLLERERGYMRGVPYPKADVVGAKDLTHPKLDLEDARVIINKIRRRLVGQVERDLFERILAGQYSPRRTFAMSAGALPRVRKAITEVMSQELKGGSFDEIVAAIRAYRLFQPPKGTENRD